MIEWNYVLTDTPINDRVLTSFHVKGLEYTEPQSWTCLGWVHQQIDNLLFQRGIILNSIFQLFYHRML